jgi:hypothetical protein
MGDGDFASRGEDSRLVAKSSSQIAIVFLLNSSFDVCYAAVDIIIIVRNSYVYSQQKYVLLNAIIHQHN